MEGVANFPTAGLQSLATFGLVLPVYSTCIRTPTDVVRLGGKSPESRRGRQNAIFFFQGGGTQPSGRGVWEKEREARGSDGRERDGREKTRGVCAVCVRVFPELSPVCLLSSTIPCHVMLCNSRASSS
ncbi:hypothetical protein BDP81DRAFT_218860 [Colletotrichum phormii]|uniref:Uncharacterized protein n=1 Tax=Colletotrichum phormii TaxID=359342 RepID=A0AAI9ZV08_9PEZI|nr:uncharacterized protein BDP81DRAFT_218860 [Colletotrichum phormii]KAK1637127.1 hypothetical protein BDP81DRAFT_218860 [Colletotrichum phormii]